jgi:hypothetical protein
VTAVTIADPGQLREPAHPAADPWSVVSVIIHDLASHAIKSSYGPDADFGRAAIAAARLLEALGVQPLIRDDDADLITAAPYPLSLDIRVTAARELLAEQHQPAGMPAGDARALLARYQRRLRGLLDAIGGSGTEAGS